jgi:hypothetical protein
MGTRSNGPQGAPDLGALRAAREEARRIGAQPGLLRSYLALSEAHLLRGEVDEAESAARTAVQQARACSLPADLGRGLVALARALARTPRLDRALLHYTEALPLLAAHDPETHAVALGEAQRIGDVPSGAR